MRQFQRALDNFFSKDLEEGIRKSTEAYYEGSICCVELFDNGNYRILPGDQIRNSYETLRVMVSISPIFDAEDIHKPIDFDNADISSCLERIKEEMREELRLIIKDLTSQISEVISKNSGWATLEELAWLEELHLLNGQHRRLRG